MLYSLYIFRLYNQRIKDENNLNSWNWIMLKIKNMSRINEYMDEDYESDFKEAHRLKEWRGRALYHNEEENRTCKKVGIVMYFFIILRFI